MILPVAMEAGGQVMVVESMNFDAIYFTVLMVRLLIFFLMQFYCVHVETVIIQLAFMLQGS